MLLTLFQSALPLSVTVAHTPIRIGVIHGHQCVPNGDLDSLSAIARQMDVDVLISGHTHVYVCTLSSDLTYIMLGAASRRWNMTTVSSSTQDPSLVHG
jgi:vacuolar protein sorting-associated protein 29